MTKRNPRVSNGNARRKLRARVKAEGRVCGICGQPIDYSLPAGHPLSYELDEIVPVSLGGSPYDYENVQPAHRHCNQKKSNKILQRNEKPSKSTKNKDFDIEPTVEKMCVKTCSEW